MGDEEMMDEALEGLKKILMASDDPRVSIHEFKERIRAWNEEWIDGPMLPNVVKLSLKAAFMQVLRDLVMERERTPLHRPDIVISRSGGWYPPKGMRR